ncbi:MAG: HAMP domain-containing sensor histidine kinase [Chloroflexi bacterium]|nr:HAMP domain-containing sensor histidine kinase [Chloroflexota bacterium]
MTRHRVVTHSVRGRLALAVVGLVALTAVVLGAGSYAYVATSLRGQQLQASVELTRYNVAVLAVERLPASPTRSDLAASRLLDGFAARGILGTIVDFGDGDPFASNISAAAMASRLSQGLRATAARGDVAWERTSLGGEPVLVTAARRPSSGPTFYFLFDAGPVEDAIQRLGTALVVGGLLLVGLAVLAAGFVARGLLRPVADAAAAAERIAGGDLTARLQAGAGDELGRWAASFNRMAAALQRHVAELQDARAREERFVADVSHELRTPLTALVAEASILRAHLDALPDEPRRVGELLVSDIARLRGLVEDLMELSRFDAGVERPEVADVDAASFVRAVVGSRLPGADVIVEGADGTAASAVPLVVRIDPRRFERVLGNLLDNARIHAEGRGVEVRVRMMRAVLQVGVSDRGPGVAEAEMPRLFERFHKGDPSRHAGGSGLGLAIAAQHARVLGGTLSAERRDGGGMRFVLRVPVTRSLPSGDGAATDEVQPAWLSGTRREADR